MAKTLLIGNHRPSLALARALRRRGHEIWAGRNGYCDYLDWSRAVSGVVDLPDFDEETDFITALEAALSEGGFEVLVPVSDRATRLVAAHRARLERRIVVASPWPAIIGSCVSKTETARLCREIGVALAPMEPARDRDTVFAAAARLGYPVVVKPAEEGRFLFDRKVLNARSAEELAAIMPSWPEGHDSLLVQQRLSGPRINHYFVARSGRLLTACEVEVIRTDRRDGSGYAVEGITRNPRPHLREQTEKLVRRLGYTGAGCVQYMLSADGQASSFLEINPRLGANFLAAEAAGAGMSELVMRLALGGAPKPPRNPWENARPNVRYAWTKGDLSGWLHERRAGMGLGESLDWLGKMALSAVRADTHLTFSWRDPAPAVGCWLHPLIKRFAKPEAPAEQVQTAG